MLARLKSLFLLLLNYGPIVITVVYAAFVALQLNGSTISTGQMLTWILTLLLLLVTNQLADRFGAIRQLEQSVSDIKHDLGSGSLAERFLYEKLPDISSYLHKAKTIDVAGIVLIRFALDYHGIIEERLREGIHVRFLIVDPNASCFENVNERFSTGQSVNELRSQANTVLTTFDRFIRDPQLSKHFEIRLLPYVPTYGLRLFNRKRSDAVLWAEIFSFRDPLDAALQVTKRDGFWFNYLEQQFELMWNHAHPPNSK